MKNLTAVVAITAVFTLAVCFIMLGSVSTELMSRLGIDANQFGTLVTLFSFTCMIVQLLVGPLVDKWGHKPLAVAGLLTAGLSIFLLGFATTYAVASLATVLLGIGAICCNTVGNTLLPVALFEGKDPARASNFGCGFVGLGFVLIPLLISTFMGSLGLSYTVSVCLIGAGVLAFAVFAMTATYPRVSTGFSLSKAVSLLPNPVVLTAAAALACYIGLEWTMNNWTKPLMSEMFQAGGRDGVNAARNAGYVLALFGLAMGIGRFGTSAVRNVSAIGTTIIAGASLVAIVALLVLAKAQGAGLAILAVLVIGLAFAPMFPTIVGVTFSKFDPSVYGSVFGIIFSIGLIGSMILPKAIGRLSENRSLQQSLPIAAVIAGILLVLALAMRLAGKARPSGQHLQPKAS
ncbi:MAG: MFS transporter [Planctomycetes bacterium]|jgi:fucose permease|nr:MFS transporter [Planctomycetota bacterium]